MKEKQRASALFFIANAWLKRGQTITHRRETYAFTRGGKWSRIKQKNIEQKNLPCRKNDRAVITIHDIGSGGEGIGFLPLKEAEQKSIRPDSYHTDYIEHADDKEHTGTTGSGKSEKPGGTSRKKGFAVFVKDAVPGDTIEATITKVTARYAYGHLDRILQPSPHRLLQGAENRVG